MKKKTYPLSNFQRFLETYYSFKPIRYFVTFSTFICQFTLIIYLMIIPIQLAYHSLLASEQNINIQNNIDFVVCAFFTYHILLYFDHTVQKIIKQPNQTPKLKIQKLGKWSRLLSIEIVYDLITWGISVFMSSPSQNALQGRILQVIFFFKVFKIYKFHKKTVYTIIGTNIYPIYKIFFTIMVTFTIMSYLSSIFYAIDYAIYLSGGPIAGDIWLVGLSTEPNLIQKPFWVQLLMINYWAMGTSSTAAYGDICGVAPEQVIYNIFVLYFANFLYGYYLNNIQIIPKQIKQRQRKILEQFSQFQKYNRIGKNTKKRDSAQKFDNELYLKILCSIEYNQTQKSIKKVIQQAVPHKYMEQIKTEIYSEFFNSQHLKLYHSRGFFNNETTLLKMSKIINQSVFEKNENIYDYSHITQTDLIYIHEGSIQLTLPGELQSIVKIIKNKGQIFGEYCFITGQRRKINSVALEYVSAYIIKRDDYKKALSFEEYQDFDRMFANCLDLTDQRIKNDPYKVYNNIVEKKSSTVNFDTPSSRCKKTLQILNQNASQRMSYGREQLQSKKIFVNPIKNTKKDVSIQTEKITQSFQRQFQNVVNF